MRYVTFLCCLSLDFFVVRYLFGFVVQNGIGMKRVTQCVYDNSCSVYSSVSKHTFSNNVDKNSGMGNTWMREFDTKWFCNVFVCVYMPVYLKRCYAAQWTRMLTLMHHCSLPQTLIFIPKPSALLRFSFSVALTLAQLKSYYRQIQLNVAINVHILQLLLHNTMDFSHAAAMLSNQ